VHHGPHPAPSLLEASNAPPVEEVLTSPRAL
jgi:hypothetical protein